MTLESIYNIQESSPLKIESGSFEVDVALKY